eukprot:SAG31_NODE_3473_length_4234_cov_1.624667_3_plen_300_part_00
MACSAGPSPRLVKELRPLLERYKVAFYLNGHDHNAQHIHTADAPATEFITAGAGSPVDPRTPHSTTVKEGATWSVGQQPYHRWAGDPDAVRFFWAKAGSNGDDPPPMGYPSRPLPLAENPGGRWQTDGRETNSSFAALRFADAQTATLELVAHTGCVLYRLVKPNPRNHQGGTTATATAAAAAAAANRVTEGLGCYKPVTHTPRAVLEYQEAKRRHSMTETVPGGWLAPALVGLAVGVLVGMFVSTKRFRGRRCCAVQWGTPSSSQAKSQYARVQSQHADDDRKMTHDCDDDDNDAELL